MKKHPVRFALPVVAAGLGVLWADSKVDYDHHADFSRYRTYSWIKAEAGDWLWQDRIVRDVDAQLQAKGLQKAPSGGDVAVAAYGSVQNEKSLQTYYDGFGGGWFWRGWGGNGMATTTVENIPVGTLVVDLFDGSTKKLVWRAHGTDTLSGSRRRTKRNWKSAWENCSNTFRRNPKASPGRNLPQRSQIKDRGSAGFVQPSPPALGV